MLVLHPSRSAVLRIVLFIVACAAAMAAVGPAAGLVAGLAGSLLRPPLDALLYPTLTTAALLLVTWAAFRREGASLGTLGLVPPRRRAAEFAAGFAASALLFAAVALVRAAWVDAAWTFDAGAGLRAALFGLPLAFVRLLPEELIFRGYAFRTAAARWGSGATILVSALLFGAYHVVGPLLGGTAWGMGAVFLFTTPALGGLLFGLAAHRTGGLALPTGLHFGANWVNASVLGLAMPPGAALWSAPMTAPQIATLTAPDVLVHLPYLAGVALLLIAVTVWARRPVPAPALHRTA